MSSPLFEAGEINMPSYSTRRIHFVIIISLTIGIMIVYAMPDQGNAPETNEPLSQMHTNATPSKAPPTMSVPLTPPDRVDITALSVYDRDHDGNLSKHERGVIKHDYLHKRLTTAQMKCAVEVLGYVPSVSPIPTATVAPTANASEAVVNTTPNETTPSNTTSPVSVGFDRMKSVVKDMIDDLMKTIVQGCGQAISGIFDRWSADAN